VGFVHGSTWRNTSIDDRVLHWLGQKAVLPDAFTFVINENKSGTLTALMYACDGEEKRDVSLVSRAHCMKSLPNKQDGQAKLSSPS